MLIDERGRNISIGTDIVEIDRFRNLEDASSFYHRVFSERELAYCLGFSDPSPHFASTFAGKEAVFKATSSNCRATLRNIEILREQDGAPYVELHQACNHDIYVSLSHSSSHAVAVAIAVHEAYSQDVNEIRGILEKTANQILPRSEVS
ncbi:MAG: holo-ACP synthase [Candidatus Sifarchaeia archaeon]